MKKTKKNIKSVEKNFFSREEAERLAAEERERAKKERRCPECGNKVFLFFFNFDFECGNKVFPFFPGIF